MAMLAQKYSAYPRRVFVSLLGQVPQILTESLYALVRDRGFIPTEICLLTTENLVDDSMDRLLDPDAGAFYQLCDSLGIDRGAIHFDRDSFCCFRDHSDRALEDILTPEDNVAAADCVMSVVRGLCADEHTVVHASLAGGRKSLAYFIGTALSFFGRTQDELSHVMVSAEYVNNSNFYYPLQPSQDVSLVENGKPRRLKACDATITLSDVPFLRLREVVPEATLEACPSFSNTVAAVQQQVRARIRLAFDVPGCRILCNDLGIKVAPEIFAAVLWMASNKKCGLGSVRPGEAGTVDGYRRAYRLVAKNSEYYDRTSAFYDDACSFLAKIQSAISKYHKRLNESLALGVARRYQIRGDKKIQDRATGYCIETPAEAIDLPQDYLNNGR